MLYSRNLIKNSESAEDIVQDVFLRLFESGRLEQASPSFLFTCVKNASLNYLHSSLNKHIPISFEQNQISDKEIQEEISHMEQLEELDKAIEALPDKCKDIFIRVYLQQQRYEDVAVQLNISYHTVKAHMSSAFKHLRKRLLLLFILFRNVKF